MQRLARVAAAALFLTGGAVHLDLWRGGYEGIPYVGPMFLANVIVSAIIAIALLFRRDSVLLLGGLALASGSLVALVLSRTVGLLGFMEAGFSPEALRTVAAEVGAIVAVAVVFTINRPRQGLVAIPARVR